MGGPLPFWLSIGLLSIVQGGLVAVPARWPWAERRFHRFRSGWWAFLPLAALVGVAYGLTRVADAPQGLTYLALVAVPVLAAVALGWSMRGARPVLAAGVVLMFALAWADPTGLSGEAAALALTALSCVSLGIILVGLAPAGVVKLGIVAMAAVDVALVVNDQLQRPNSVLGAAHPVAQLPRLQSVLFGSALMGYGDLLVAGLAGALLVGDRWLQNRTAVLVMILALVGDLAFFRVTEFPATVPVALAVVAVEIWTRRGRRARGRAGGGGVCPPAPGGTIPISPRETRR
jgi:hypothetical protein